MRVNKPPIPNEIKGSGKNINHGLAGLNAHHFSEYPTMDIRVEIIKAFFFPTFVEMKVMIGITRNAVAIALKVPNHAGH